MPNELPILDKDAALATTGGDAELAQILLETCVEESPKLIQEARDAVAKHDFATARRCGHSLKSSFGVVGAAIAAAQSEKLEFTLADEVDEFQHAIDSVDSAFQQLSAQVNA